MDGQLTLALALARRPDLLDDWQAAAHQPAEAAAVAMGGLAVWTHQIHCPRPRVWDEHEHAEHELIWDGSGTIAVQIEGELWIVPPSMGLWIPARARHLVSASRGSSFACSFIASSAGQGPARPGLVTVHTLAREALRELGEPEVTVEMRKLLSQVAPAFVRPIASWHGLRMPVDDRAALVARALLADPADDRSLQAWAELAHSSQRTLSRAFVAETGLAFGRWRTELRLRRAAELLGTGIPVATVAGRVGYRSVSAFTVAFREFVGQAPGAFGRAVG